MSLAALFLATFGGLCVLMSIAWAVQRRTGQSGWIDVAWSIGVGVAGALLALAPTGEADCGARQFLVAFFALAGALRLGLHISARSFNAGEDPRYHDLAIEWGGDFSRRLFWFLQIQAACAFLLSGAVFLAAHNPAAFPSPTDIVGCAVLVVAIAGEAWSDAALARYRSSRRHREGVCMIGPWAWSRHPNYFFQWLIWVGFAIVALNFDDTWPQGSFALLAPVFMYWLLVHVSGVPPLEKHMLASRGDAFRAYQARVNVFFPGPPRRP